MNIKTFNRKQLADFIQSEDYKNMPHLPITPLRVLSQCANPAAQDEDILLFLAEDKGEMLGYCGMLPDRFYFSNAKNQRIAWITGLWVNPILRGRGIGKLLVKTALDTWEKNMYVTEFEPKTLPIYESLGLKVMTKYHKQTIYDMGKWHHLIALKYPSLQKFQFMFDFLGKMSKPFFEMINPKIDFSAFSFQKIDKIAGETACFIQKQQENAFFRRTAAELNWITDFPWLKEMPEKDEIANRYYFSYQAKIFRQEWIQMCEKKTGKIIACFLLSQRDINLKVPYYFIEKKYNYNDIVATWIFHYFQKSTACVLHVFAGDLYSSFILLAFKHKKIRLKTEIKTFLHHNSTFTKDFMSAYFEEGIDDEEMAKMNEMMIQDGDGDCAFT